MRNQIFYFLSFIFCIVSLKLVCQATGEIKQVINKTDAKGQKQGYWRKVDNNGHLKYEGKFINNIPVDTFKYYNINDKLENVSVYTNNGKNIKTKMLYQNGKIKCEGFYSGKEIKDSIWKYYNESGALIAEEFYRHNIKEGVWKTYYDNGKVDEEISWKDNVKDGIWRQYFEDGTLKLSCSFKNNLFDGQFKAYYSSGIILISGFYKDGLKEGKWLYYKEMMQIEKTEEYKDGILINQEIK